METDILPHETDRSKKLADQLNEIYDDLHIAHKDFNEGINKA